MEQGRPSKYETYVAPRLNEVADWLRNGATEKEIAKRLDKKKEETMGIKIVNVNGVVLEQPRTSLSVVENQKLWQWTNKNDFYKMGPAPYYGFYNNWVR